MEHTLINKVESENRLRFAQAADRRVDPQVLANKRVMNMEEACLYSHLKFAATNSRAKG